MIELSAFGKELRKLRIDREERMLDMARRVGKSVSFISAIETGAKPVPPTLIDKIGAEYDLPAAEIENLKRLAIMSANEVRIRMPAGAESRDMVSMFARFVERGGEFVNDEERKRFLEHLSKR